MSKVNVRQRVIETLNHREPDVLVIDFGGMRSTGISAIAYNKLKEYLGLAGGATRLYDVFQQLAEPEPEILAKLGGDFVQLHRYAPAFGIRIDRWKPGRLPDGSACLAPEGYDPITNERGELEIRDGDVVVGRMPAGGLYFDQVLHPYADITTKPQIDRLCMQEITAAELAHLEREAKCLHETTDKAILGAFGGNILEAGQTSWGYERFMTALALEPDLVHYWLEKLTETYMRDLEKYLGDRKSVV